MLAIVPILGIYSYAVLYVLLIVVLTQSCFALAIVITRCSRWNNGSMGSCTSTNGLDRCTELIRAIETGDIRLATEILNGLNLKYAYSTNDQYVRTYLHRAVQVQSHLEIVAALLENGARVNERDVYGKVPLHYAVSTRSPSIAMVNLLLSHGASAETFDHSLETPFQSALERYSNEESIAVVKLLLDRGCAKIDGRGGLFHQTPLMMAIRYYPPVELVAYLLQKGPDLNAHDALNRTVLHYAAICNCPVAVVNLLIANGADLSAYDVEGRTPLHYAALLVSLENMTAYLDPNNVNCLFCQDRNGQTPIDLARNRSLTPEVVVHFLKEVRM